MGTKTSMADKQVRILSKNLIKASLSNDDEQDPRVIHLTAWDLKLLSIDYIQKGLLFRIPNSKPQQSDHPPVIARLISSFARALDRFFPLAGRLKITRHDSAISVALVCNGAGAEFIHATASEVTVDAIAGSVFVPAVVLSLFPLNRVINYDGHIIPLMAVQVTELSDGIFIGMSLNHCAADGFSFWHFFNTWSLLSVACDTATATTTIQPILDRWFTPSFPPPIKLPFANQSEFITRYHPSTTISECAFHFSASSVAHLKQKANHKNTTHKNISSLQSVLSHLWRAVVRACNLQDNQETTYTVVIGCRNRLSPPLPDEYLGNSLFFATATAKAGELVNNEVGWAAELLNRTVAKHRADHAVEMLDEWVKKPSFTSVEHNKPWNLITGSSPRFEVYGNDFGWGKPVTVRSGSGNKVVGKATVYPGPEKGSMMIEVCEPMSVLEVMMKDKEFMEMVSVP